MRISIIVAVAENGVIGRGGKLPWHLAEDLKRFKKRTMGHTLVMGRKTWESIGRPLAGRRMIVVSRQADYQIKDAQLAHSLDGALDMAESAGDDEAFIIGGGEIYRQAVPRADRLYVTRVLARVDGDTWFPEIDWSDWQLIESQEHDEDAKNDYPHQFQVFQRVPTASASG